MALTTLGHHPRIRRLRRSVRDGAHRVARASYARAQQTPMPDRVRASLREHLAWQPGEQRVPIERLLLGGQNRQEAADFARTLDDPMWPSTRVQDGPHVDLLRRAAQGPLSDAEILETRYAALGRAVIVATGQFFEARTERDLVVVARRFIASVGQPAPSQRSVHQSLPGAPIEVAPIRDSDCYQVIDGHHRIARAAIAGADALDVRVRRIAVPTPLQQMLGQMSWIGGEPELYQPLGAPDVATWPTARACVDRAEAMAQVLADEGLLGEGAVPASYLDVASCYGWFVASMAQHGLHAEGLERDPLAPVVGRLALGLDEQAIHTGEAVAFLSSSARTWDVVSCFSLLHHFVLGRSNDSAQTLIRALDRATARVLFFDTGQDHEAWFATSLAGWDTAAVRTFLEANTTFDRVFDLGPDQDGTGRYRGNYGRHLFACIRDEAGPRT